MPLNFRFQLANKERFKYSYFPRTIKVWNNLTKDIVLKDVVHLFALEALKNLFALETLKNKLSEHF